MAKRKEDIERGEGRGTPDDLNKEIERTRAELGETIDAITGKFSAANIRDRALGGIRSFGKAGGSAGTRASDIGSRLIDTIRRNPVPAAMAGIGILWLFSKKDGGRSIRYPEADEPRAEHGPRRTEIITETKEVPFGAEGREISFESEESPIAGLETGGREGGLREKASEYAEGAKETAREYKEYAKGKAKEYARGYGGLVEEKGMEARGYFEDIIRDYPLAIAGFAFAIGALMGFGVPGSETERAAFGGAGERLKDAAEETAKEVKEEVKEEAKRAA